MVIIKRCPCCKKIKTESDFYKNKREKYNLTIYCKKCQDNYGKKWYNRVKNNQEYKRKQALKAREYVLKFKIKNPEEYKKRTQLYYKDLVAKAEKRNKYFNSLSRYKQKVIMQKYIQNALKITPISNKTPKDRLKSSRLKDVPKTPKHVKLKEKFKQKYKK